VLVYAHRGGTPEYERIGAWLEMALNGDAPFGLVAYVCTKPLGCGSSEGRHHERVARGMVLSA
jgi:hypothetical protein